MPKCRYCKQKFEASNSLAKFCSYEHAMAYLATPEGAEKHKKAKVKLEKIKEKEHRKKTREFYRRDLKWQHKRTQTAFNKMRRLEEFKWFQDRGLEPACISCGGTKMDWACGHLKTVASSGVLRYNRVNTHLQCNRNCNEKKSGNIENYKLGLLERYGENIGGAMLEYLDITQHKTADWTWQQLEQMRKEFNARIRKLEQQFALDECVRLTETAYHN